MDTLSPPPVITTEAFEVLAEKFADLITNELIAFNERNPKPDMSEDDWKRVDQVPTGRHPKDFREIFKTVFCSYMASRYIITP